MTTHTHRSSAPPWGGRFVAAVGLMVLVLALGGRPAMTQNTTPAPGPLTGTDALNDALFIERLAADLFTRNAEKSFLTTVPATNPPTNPPTPDGDAATTQDGEADLAALRRLVQEMRDHHTAHAALLEQRLGANAPARPTFQRTRLDVSSLTQFLETALLVEEAAVNVLQGAILRARQSLPDGTPAAETPAGQDEVTLLVSLGMTDAIHLGALRSWRLRAGTALGGDPNTALTTGTLIETRTVAQLNTLLQPFLAEPVTTPPPDDTTPPPDNGTTNPPGGTDTGSLAVATVTISPPSIQEVQAVTITVTLNDLAPDGGVNVRLTSSNQALLAIPQNLLIPEGQRAASLQVRPTAGIFGTVTITAAIGNGRAASATLTVLAG